MPKSTDKVGSENLSTKDFLTPREAATIMGCSYDKVRDLMASGKLRYGEIGPRVKRISRVSIDNFMASCGGEK